MYTTQMIADETSEQTGFKLLSNKNLDLTCFVFFWGSNNKSVISCVLTVFSKTCGLVVILARIKQVSPAYHLHKWGIQHG